jgi:hypothetical protein
MITNTTIKLAAQVRVKPSWPVLSAGNLNIGIPLTDIPLPGLEDKTIATTELILSPSIPTDFDFSTLDGLGDINGVLFEFYEMYLLAITADRPFQVAVAPSVTWATAPIGLDSGIHQYFLAVGGPWPLSPSNNRVRFSNPSDTDHAILKIIAIGLTSI